MDQKSFRAAVGAGKLIAGKLSALEKLCRIPEGEFHGAGSQPGVINEDIALPLAGSCERTGKPIAEPYGSQAFAEVQNRPFLKHSWPANWVITLDCSRWGR